MAFLQEPAHQPFLRVPAVTAGLIAALVLAHVARVFAPVQQSAAIIDNYAFFPARYSHAFLAAHGAGPQSFWELAIPFVSYIFIHANYTHLALNCIWLLPFGAIVARRLGALFFLLFFLVCGVAGAVAHLVTHWGSADFAIGASAAVAGLMAAGFRMIALVDETGAANFADEVSGKSTFRRPLAPLFSPRVLLWSAVTIAIFVVWGLAGIGTGPGPQVVAWQAHIGGYLAGLVLVGPFDFAESRIRA